MAFNVEYAGEEFQSILEKDVYAFKVSDGHFTGTVFTISDISAADQENEDGSLDMNFGLRVIVDPVHMLENEQIKAKFDEQISIFMLDLLEKQIAAEVESQKFKQEFLSENKIQLLD